MYRETLAQEMQRQASKTLRQMILIFWVRDFYSLHCTVVIGAARVEERATVR